MKLKFFTAVCIIAAFISSCKKEETTHGNYEDIQSFIRSKKPQSQFFTMNAEEGGVVVGGKGTEISFPPDAFSYPDGTEVTGTVEVELLEIFSNADMIFSGVIPRSYGSVLNSAGECFIQVTKDDVALVMNEDKFYTLEMPAQAYDPGMIFFAGMVTVDTVNWVPVSPSGDSLFSYNFFEYNSLDNTYAMLTDSLGWINCDVFSPEEQVSCTFRISGIDEHDFTNTAFYGILDDMNSVITIGEIYTLDDGELVLSETNIPAVDMHLLVISIIDGNLYYALEGESITEGGVYEISIMPGTEAELDAAIASLP